ncbi:MAG: glutamate--tRNA ligase [Candidatus Babeliales bacterium]
MNSTSVRVRFAPSPTGHLHIGGLRTAIFNWLFARHHNGTFVLRIEDTDLERSKQEYTESILGSLTWADIQPDEPILIQSTRISQHRAIAHELITQGKAYRCYCTPEEIVERQKIEVGDVLYSKYDEFCRGRTHHDITKSHVIRFAIPEDVAQVAFHDLIRGTVTFNRDQLDDFIIVRSDGIPVYNFVVVLDDAFMRISHVIRGEEHLSNTPKQMLLYQACDYPMPLFAHLPMILGPSGEKLSKRDGATSVLEYKQMGFLPEALVNYLVRLGWSHGDQEIFTREELITYFALEQVGKKGSIFDQAKLDWVNTVYLKEQSSGTLYTYMQDVCAYDLPSLFPQWTREQVMHAITLYKERVKTIRDLIAEMTLLYQGPSEYSSSDVQQWVNPPSAGYLDLVVQKLAALPTFTVDTITDVIKQVCAECGIKLVTVAQPIRLALVGKTSSPGVFELLALLGKEASLARLTALLAQVR